MAHLQKKVVICLPIWLWKKTSCEGLNFSLPPKYLHYADYLFNFEIFYRNIRNLGILSNEDLDLVKTKTKKAALGPCRNYNNNVP